MNYEVFQLTRVGSLSGLVWEPSPLLSNSFGWIFPQAQIFSSDAHTDQYFDEYLRWILLALHNFLFVFLTSNLSRTIDGFSSLTVNFRFSTQRQYQDLLSYPSLYQSRETFCYYCCSVSQSCPMFCDLMDCSSQASLPLTISQSLFKLMSIESVVLSNHRILCHSLLLLLSVFPSIKVLFDEWVLHISWLNYWSFSFNISPSNEYSGLISFRIDWFDLLALQGTLKCLLQHHRLKVFNLCCSAFFMVQLSHSYMTTEQTIALILQIFVSKVMSLLFNMLSRFVIVFFQGASVF